MKNSEHITQVISRTWSQDAQCTCGWKREIASNLFDWWASRKALRLAREHEQAQGYVQELED